jgi:hypothetical protein
MIDNPEKTTQLLAALKDAVPFKVELTERLIKHLRGQHDAVAGQTEHIVSDLSYAGVFLVAGQTKDSRYRSGAITALDQIQKPELACNEGEAEEDWGR